VLTVRRFERREMQRRSRNTLQRSVNHFILCRLCWTGHFFSKDGSPGSSKSRKYELRNIGSSSTEAIAMPEHELGEKSQTFR
jgi:hypothetical protein